MRVLSSDRLPEGLISACMVAKSVDRLGRLPADASARKETHLDRFGASYKDTSRIHHSDRVARGTARML